MIGRSSVTFTPHDFDEYDILLADMARDKEMVTTGDVARALGVTINTVKTWTDTGVIESIRLPSGHLRIPRHELERLRRPAAARERGFEHFERWRRDRAYEYPPLAEALAWVSGLLDFARTHGQLPEASPAEKANRVARLHKALSVLPG